MFYYFICFLFLFANFSPLSFAETTPPQNHLILQARESINKTQQALFAELQKAINQQGLLGAIQVCQTKALPLTKEQNAQNNISLKRVAKRIRQPLNQPDDWETAQLKLFEERLKAGEPIEKIESYATIGQQFRYMKAIPTGGMCLQCHGNSVTTSVSQKIKELYPNDQAIGFKLGELRGAWSFTAPLNKL